MVRFSGQPLPAGCRIAVVANDAIGNFVVATPLLQMLRERHRPSALHYFGGTRTSELQQASVLADAQHLLQGCSPGDFCQMIESLGGSFDLIFNCESTAFSKAFVGMLAGDDTFVAGPSIGPGGRGELRFQEDARGDLWRDKEWIAADITSKYPFLRSGFIGEIFCRLAYLDGMVPRYAVPTKAPGADTPPVLIATAASMPDKLWPISNWRESVRWIRARGFTVGLLGAPPNIQREFWSGSDDETALIGSSLAEDLRGRFTLPEVAGALAQARAVLTLDNGILHLAAAAETPTVGLFRHGIHRLWAPPVEGLQVLTPGEGRAVSEIPVQSIQEALDRVL